MTSWEDRIEPPLPRKVRLRLWLTGCIDDVAYWLACHDRANAAERLYRFFRLWK